MEGTIKWYNPKNGYGFIAGIDGQDYFVHFTAIPEGTKIYPDDKVSFDAVETEKGKQAQNVQKIGEAAPKVKTTTVEQEPAENESNPKSEEPEEKEEDSTEENDVDTATEEAINAKESTETTSEAKPQQD